MGNILTGIIFILMGKPLLSCKWAFQIVIHLVSSPKRPSELKRLIPDIDSRVLFDRLRRLVRAGLVGKKENEGYPKETLYYLRKPEVFKEVAYWFKGLALPAEEVVSVVSCKWTLEILSLLKDKKTPRDIKKVLVGLSDKVLHSRLYQLEKFGLVRREVFPEKPVKVSYSLTEKGMSILPVLIKMREIILYSEKKRSPCPSLERGS